MHHNSIIIIIISIIIIIIIIMIIIVIIIIIIIYEGTNKHACVDTPTMIRGLFYSFCPEDLVSGYCVQFQSWVK